MNPMFSSRYLSPDAHDSGGVPAEAATPMVSPASATPAAPAVDMVSRSEYNNLQEQLSRAEGRAKTSQRLSSAAESLGYSDPNQLADYLQQSAAQQKQYQDQASQYQQQQQYAQQYYPQGYQQQQPQQSSVTPEMIDNRINQHIGVSQANSSHELHREAEQNFINQMITNPEMAKIFEGVEVGEYGNVFNAAYSGAGSAASEIIASAIDNAIYGLSTQYGDDAPERLRGRSMPIKDPEVFQQVQSRVMEGLKELSAMSVFAATQKGMVDPQSVESVPIAVGGEELSPSQLKAKRSEEISDWTQQRFDDASSAGQPLNQ